jgi:hypothetical protein
MGRRLIPDPVEIRDRIQRLRDDTANWRTLIENAKDRISRLGGHDQAEDQPPPERRPGDE